MAEALALREVTAGYGETVVLEDLSFAVDSGESLSIIGRNGVGKTTLLATIMGHTSLHNGTIDLNGQSISELSIHRRAHAGLGYVPQEREIFPSLTLRENLLVGARPGRWTQAAVYELFPALAARVHLAGNHLSGGEQQMLSIGRALMGNPTMLLMDEPSEGLAPIIVAELLRVLHMLRAEDGQSIVLVEQNTRVALAFSERTVVMDRGSIQFDGASEELRRDEKLLDSLIGVAGM